MLASVRTLCIKTFVIGISAGIQNADICPLGMSLDFELLNSSPSRIISVIISHFFTEGPLKNKRKPGSLKLNFQSCRTAP